MSDWTDDERKLFDEVRSIIKRGDRESLIAYVSGIPAEKLDELGGVSSKCPCGDPDSGPCDVCAKYRCRDERPTPWVTPGEDYECPNGGRCIELAEEAAELRAMISCSGEPCCTESDRLIRERDRALSANDTLVKRIEDLTQGYATEDTCPRVQCRTTSKRLHAELGDLDKRLFDSQAERIRLHKALDRIATTNPDPRPDGTHNISREALIDWAQDAIAHTDTEERAHGEEGE